MRRLRVPAGGRYQVSLVLDEAFRVCIDGNKVLERGYGGGDPFAAEIVLRPGVHDVSIEYADRTEVGARFLAFSCSQPTGG